MFGQNLTFLRSLIILVFLALLFLLQCYWFVRAWRLASRPKNAVVRILCRGLCMGALALLVYAVITNFIIARHSLLWHRVPMTAWTGLWLSSSLFAFLAMQVISGFAWLYGMAEACVKRVRRNVPHNTPAALPAVNPSRRRFVHAATMAAGAIPFAAAAYGFAYERFRYQIHKVDLPVPGLPPELAGLRIAQLSDIHIGSYLTAADVRRAVAMANELRADLIVVTGDFLTSVNDPLESCIAELSRLRAPLGVWGCNGNHEIYAGVEAYAAELFSRHGMRLLRQQSAELIWHGQPFNLLGVDYQRERDADGIARPMLSAIEALVRRDVPNILLSHNPNSFRRAAELGIELMLAGHTHGGQVTVEILDHRLSAARFLTPYVAGMYLRPLGAPARLEDDDPALSSAAVSGASTTRPAVLYVNRGLGTIAMPVRIGVPPEITLHTLHRA